MMCSEKLRPISATKKTKVFGASFHRFACTWISTALECQGLRQWLAGMVQSMPRLFHSYGSLAPIYWLTPHVIVY